MQAEAPFNQKISSHRAPPKQYGLTTLSSAQLASHSSQNSSLLLVSLLLNKSEAWAGLNAAAGPAGAEVGPGPAGVEAAGPAGVEEAAAGLAAVAVAVVVTV